MTDDRYFRGLKASGNNARHKEFLAKLKSGAPLVYGAIGGSITEGAAASDASLRYVERFASFLRDYSDNKNLKVVNAGIGASNSLFGTFRIGKDLLSHKPDIITIEYAVNDSTNPDTEAAYESLVRKCLTELPETPLILIFTMNSTGVNFQDIHSKVGAHYNLPMLSYKDAIYPDVSAGIIKWQEISPDTVHPNDLGHGIISVMLSKFIKDTDKAPADKQEAVPALMNSKAASYAKARIIDASAMEMISQSGWKQGPHKGGYTGWQTESPDASLELSFEGSYVSIGVKQYSGDYGRAEVSLDNGNPVLLEGYFQKFPNSEWAGGHTVLTVLGDGLPAGRHILKLKMLKERHSGSNGHSFDFGYILVS